jgi:hypothetical protein
MSVGPKEQHVIAADETPGLRAKMIAVFAVAQVSLMLCSALARLTPVALEPWKTGALGTLGMGVAISWGIFNAYAEGYRGFQRRFSPRTVARAAYLGENPRLVDVVLALPFTLGLYFTNRRQLMVSWGLLVGIVGLIVAVRALPQPYRGVVDGGVVVGLGWGLLSLLYSLGHYLATGKTSDPELPPASRLD